MNDGLFQGNKPVLWSVVEKTALAEAEVEYEDFTSDTVWVKFPVVVDKTYKHADLLDRASIVIWTTTPWTLPGNRAISYSDKIAYGLYEVVEAPEGNWAKVGDLYILADKLAEDVAKQARVKFKRVISIEDFRAMPRCEHPLKELGYKFQVPLLEGHHVTDDAGTGFVHTAPGHGREDYDAWISAQDLLQKAGIDTAIPYTVDADGFFTEQAPGFTGKRVITDKGEKGDANEAVIQALIQAGMLIARGRMKHQYPHSWRSKKPLIFRNTPQWFIGMERNDLRKKALQAINDTRFVPESGRNRLYAMIEQRPDWCVSRQRAWGVPIAVFVEKKSGQPLKDPEVNQRIVEAFKKDGADAWFAPDAPQKFLGNKYKAEDYEQVRDIIEVWFESGSTHAFCLEQRPELKWPADLYLEGSDQHRGWFHSSLLESCGTRGRAPYDAVLTHGFVLDEQGRKMSKSLGNVVAPQDVIGQHGADILRLWVVASNFAEDLSIGPEIIKSTADSYRRLRNTLRYLLGALAGFTEEERLPEAEMPELERFVLHRLWQLDQVVRKGVEDFDFHEIYVQLHQFCAVDLSAFYFDIRKDSLYCDRPGDKRRRACRTAMDRIFSCLTAWLAPILCFTAEEAWLTRQAESGRKGEGEESVHLRLYSATPAAWRDDALAERWEKLRQARRVVTGALELERAAKRIGSSLQAAPVVHADAAWRALLAGVDLDELCITAGATASADPAPAGAFALPDVAGVAVAFHPAAGHKCERCWKVLPEVAASPLNLCLRCTAAVGGGQQAAE